jgi:uncharacterized protein YjbJ (UPF0337 family)
MRVHSNSGVETAAFATVRRSPGDLSDTLRVLLRRTPHDRFRGTINQPEEYHMGMDDKAGNKAEDLKGKVKESTGKATDDESLEAEGKTDQSKSSLKQAGENVKDAFKK